MEAVSYDAPSPVGASAAEIVAKFGSRRTARFEPRPPDPFFGSRPAAARGKHWPAQVSVSVTSAGEGVEVVRCPPDVLNGTPAASDWVTLLVPVRVTLEFSGRPEVSFDASLVVGRGTRYEASIRGHAQLFGAKAEVQVELDADDVEVKVGTFERKDLPDGLYWSSLCSADANAYVPAFFGTIPAPLVKDAAGATLTCSKGSETSVTTSSSTTQPLPFLLTRVDTPGCREIGQDIAHFRGEVSAADGASFMPHSAPASMTIDMADGHAYLSFDTELPPSELLRSFHACPGPPPHALFTYQLHLERDQGGTRAKSELFQLGYSCEDIVVRCSRGLPEAR